MISNNNCNICPRKCDVDRSRKTGYCGASDKLKINIYQHHYGEEPIISGTQGSGTIFFSYCNLRCVYCQNHTISEQGLGKEYSIEELSLIMLELQLQNVHNINLVTPTHFSYKIKQAIIAAKQAGLRLPIVWNTNSYEEIETLKDMEGLVDIYLPDLKYFDSKMSLKYSGSSDYPDKAVLAIKEMHRQVGNIKLKNDIAFRGLLLRLLVLPYNINSIENILKWVNDNLGNDTYISLMGQYYPTHKAHKYKELSRGINESEYDFALEILDKYGFENGFIQNIGSDSSYTPDFEN